MPKRKSAAAGGYMQGGYTQAQLDKFSDSYLNQSGLLVGVTRDALSGKYVPANATEWGVVLAAAGIGSGGPSALWLCQEASGNLADSIGAFTMTAAGTGVTYQQSVTGWTRKALQSTDNSTGRFASASASLPDPTTTSYLLLAYVNVLSAPASLRSFMEYGASTRSRLEILAAPKFQVTMPANVATGTADPTGAVRPYVLQHNFTASANAGYSDAEKLVPAFTNATTAKQVSLGSISLSNPAWQILYGALFVGGAAEWTSTQLKAVEQVLGWTVAWS